MAIDMDCIDLFAGSGGFSTGAKMAGCKVVWAANHWREAVEIHSKNHPDAQHECQDLHQANWLLVPAHDLMLASPCCQGHSKARGKSSNNPQHDASRSTAWAVVSCLEAHKPRGGIVENVPEFLQWVLYPAWEAAIKALGYSMSPHIVDTADLGVPQNRIRLFLVLTKSASPLVLDLPKYDWQSARSFIDFDGGKWQPVNKPGRAAATLERVIHGRKNFGERFVFSYYGNTKTSRSIDRPIGTITTKDRWAVVDGDRMRILTKFENRDAMSFPSDYILPESHRLAVHMLGNAVPPVAAKNIITAFKKAA